MKTKKPTRRPSHRPKKPTYKANGQKKESFYEWCMGLKFGDK